MEAVDRERSEWELSAIDPHDRCSWRSGVRSAMRAASQLHGRGPLMWMLPLYLHVNKKSVVDDDDDILPCPLCYPILLYWLLVCMFYVIEYIICNLLNGNVVYRLPQGNAPTTRVLTCLNL